MKKWNLVIDVALCNNCANCTLAALDEHVGNSFPGYAAPQQKDAAPWIDIRRHVRGEGEHVDVNYMPTMCNHCDKPHCAEGAMGAIVKRADGIVIIDPEKAKGRRDLVDKCPYGAIHWNDALQVPQIWIFDAHLLDAGWRVPRCEQACPTGAYRSLKVSDEQMKALAQEEELQVLRPELDSAPRVHYKNLQRMNRRFVSGSVVSEQTGVPECLAECIVSLEREGVQVGQTVTDWFGDFKIDSLPDESVDYDAVFHHPEHDTARVPVKTDAAGKTVGVVTLSSRDRE